MSKYYQSGKFAYIRHSHGEKLVGGYHRDIESDSAGVISAHGGELPPGVDLRLYLNPVVDHSGAASCSVEAIATAHEYLLKRHQQKDLILSRWFIYYNARAVFGTPSPQDLEAKNLVEDIKTNPVEDMGTSFADAIASLQKYGACGADIYADQPGIINEKPPEQLYQAILPYTLELPKTVAIDLDSFKTHLAAGYPVAFGLEVFTSFGEVGEDGLVLLPDLEMESHLGSHALLAVGYSDLDEVVIARNSWGVNWGDRGYCYLPYEYFKNPDLLGNAWLLRQHQDLPPTQDHWLGGDSLFYQEDYLEEFALDEFSLEPAGEMDIFEMLEDDDYLSESELESLAE
jgi:hypothetical protein